MTDQRPSIRHLLFAIVVLLAGHPAHGADLSPTMGPSTAPHEFRSNLREHAIARVGLGTPAYFAIIRRGLDRYDEQRALGRTTRATLNDLTRLDATPEAVDRDPDFQITTMLRLGFHSEPEARIVGPGGIELAKGQYDDAVMLSGHDFLCSGVALNQSTVLTAAHCACDLRLAQAEGEVPDRRKVVVVGLSNAAGSTTHRIDVGKTRFISQDVFGAAACPDIRPGLQAGHPDLALVQLKDGAVLGTPQLKIGSHELLEAAIGSDFFFVIGFGCTKQVIRDGRFLRCDSGSTGRKFAALINRSGQCSNPSAPDGCAPGAKEFALRDSAEKTDTCGGDSGGPTVLRGGDKVFLVGITSRALDPSGICGKGGIYDKVTTPEVKEWLRQAIGLQ